MQKVNLWGHAAEVGAYAMTKFRELQQGNPVIGDVRGKGLMIGIELVKDEKRTPGAAEADAMKDALLRHGILIGVGGTYGNVMRFQPPLVITRQQVDRAVEAFAAALREVAQPVAV